MKYLLTISLLFISILAHCQQGNYITLKLKTGLEVEVKVLSMEKKKITIEKENRSTSTINAEVIESIDGMSYDEFYDNFETSPNALYSYTASNGITYKPGDTIILGRGSNANGDFRYLILGGFAQSLYALGDEIVRSETLQIGSMYSGLGVVIKKIKTVKLKGISKVYFVVGGGNITNYWLYIEDAIATCEVRDCKEPEKTQSIQVINQSDKFDQLKKLKDLLDSGILTEEEYQIEKKKLLDKD
jgi:hypothetical protein